MMLGELDDKRGPFSQDAVGVDSSIMSIDNLPANGESDARAFEIVVAVESLEDLEYPLAMLRIKSDPIVPHLDSDHVSLLERIRGTDHLHSRHHSPAAKLERVSNQVLEELAHLGLIDLRLWEFSDMNLGPRFLDEKLECQKSIAKGI